MSTVKMSGTPAASNPYFSKSYVDGVYIPSGLLVLGCLIVKREWLPYAIALSLALGGWKVYSMSMDLLLLRVPTAYCLVEKLTKLQERRRCSSQMSSKISNFQRRLSSPIT
jgi:hypothetical protein